MKRVSCITVVLSLLMVVSTGDVSQAQAAARPESARTADAIKSVAGTTWEGTDSEGDYYEFTFLKGGQLRYRTNTSRNEMVTFQDQGDVWTQDGDTVIILIDDFATRIGTLNGDRISGRAWNASGKRWSWEVKAE